MIFIAIAQISSSQQTTKKLTEEEKIELRKKNGKSYYSTKKVKQNKQLTFTNTTIQKLDVPTTIKVKYYYGKTDTVYKELTYTKP